MNSNKVPVAPDTATDPTLGDKRNARGETYFDGTREYPCQTEGCLAYGGFHSCDWTEDTDTHVALEIQQWPWGLRVYLNIETVGWAVAPSMDDSWPIDRSVSNAFTSAMATAFDLADSLNRDRVRIESSPQP